MYKSLSLPAALAALALVAQPLVDAKLVFAHYMVGRVNADTDHAKQDIDQAMVLGCAHPMGPLTLTDLVGLDTVKAIADSMYGEFKEPMYSPPPMLLRMVEAGRIGKKAGHGFYRYDTDGRVTKTGA